MTTKYKEIVRFFQTDIWQIQPGDVYSWQYRLIQVCRYLLTTIRFFTARRVMEMASALTFSTLLAIVPILAVVFAIARGFGFSIYIENQFKEAFSSQPQAANTIIGFVNSYLIHTQKGWFLGIGLLFMLFTVLNLTNNIEKAFNYIWNVEYPRSLFRTITDYLAMFFMIPVIMVLTSGLSIFMATVAGRLDTFMVLGPMMRFVIFLMPYVLMSAVFTGLYLFMPNTKVKFWSALIPGIVAGVAMQFLQLFYIHAQIFLTGYNAIYGSFAALPLFMLWVNISWSICLFGAELSYTIQNMEVINMDENRQISHQDKMQLSILLLQKICQRFKEEKKPYSAFDLKKETHIPIRLVQLLLHDLRKVHLINETAYTNKDEVVRYQPAIPLTNITVGRMVDELDTLGDWQAEPELQTSLNPATWKQLYLLRQDYLDKLRNIEITKLKME